MADNISNEHKLLPPPDGDSRRQSVLRMVELHFADCDVEKVSMAQVVASNKAGLTRRSILIRRYCEIHFTSWYRVVQYLVTYL